MQKIKDSVIWSPSRDANLIFGPRLSRHRLKIAVLTPACTSTLSVQKSHHFPANSEIALISCDPFNIAGFFEMPNAFWLADASLSKMKSFYFYVLAIVWCVRSWDTGCLIETSDWSKHACRLVIGPSMRRRYKIQTRANLESACMVAANLGRGTRTVWRHPVWLIFIPYVTYGMRLSKCSILNKDQDRTADRKTK